MLSITIGILALGVGPAIHRVLARHQGAQAALDGFILVTMAGLILLNVLPEAVAHAGWVALVAAALGFLGPTLLERVLQRAADTVHVGTLILAMLGLVVHAAIDGMALGQLPADHSEVHHGHGLEGAPEGSALPLAVILHRIPVGLTIWILVGRAYGTRVALSLLGLMAVATGVGYVGGGWLLPILGSTGIGIFESLVAGSLLHVVIHRPHRHGPGEPTHDHSSPSRSRMRALALGGLAGIGFLVVVMRMM